jgi:hypothetical protein
MRQLKIKKDKRYPLFDWFLPLILFRKKSYKRDFVIKFDKSAIYKFNDEDQYDINKLFGFSIGMHHTTSFRFGWRPTADLKRIEILTYEYQNGTRRSVSIREISLNRWYRYRLEWCPETSSVKYLVIGRTDNKYDIDRHVSSVKKVGWLNLGYTLGAYFGGNKKAPHDIIIKRISCRLNKNAL